MPERLDDFLGTPAAPTATADLSSSPAPMRLEDYIGSTPAAKPAGGIRLDDYLGQSAGTSKQAPTFKGDTSANTVPADLLGQIGLASAKQQVAAAQQNEVAHPAVPEQSFGHNLAAGYLQNFSSIASGLEQAAPQLLGSMDSDTAKMFQQAAKNTQNYQPEQGSVGGMIGGMAGGIVNALAGPAGLLNQTVNSGLQTADTADAAQRAGKIGYGQEAADIVGQTALSYITGKLGQQNVTGKLLQGVMPEAKQAALQMAKRLAATGAVEGSVNTINGLVSQAIQKYTGINPDADITEDAAANFAQGAGMGVAGSALHQAFGQHATPETKSQEQQSAPKAETAPPVQTEEPAKPLKLADLNQPDEAVETPEKLPSLGKPTGDELSPNVKSLMDRVKEHQDGNLPAEATTAEPTPAAPKTRGELAADAYLKAKQAETPAQPSSSSGEFPSSLPDAKAVGDWYGDQFKDQKNAGMIEILARTSPGGYKLADVPVDQVNPNVMGGDVDQHRVNDIANMGTDERAKLPPGILVDDGKGGLMVADGTHRYGGAKQAGDTTYRAYVPESAIGQNGVVEAGGKSSQEAPGSMGEGRGEPEPSPKVPVPGAPSPEVLHPGETVEATPPDLKTLKGRFQAAKAFLNDWKSGTQAAQSSRAKAEFDTAHAVSALKPYEDIAAKMTPEEKTAWVDSMDKTGTSTNPALDDVEAINRRLNTATKDRAAAVGLNSDDWRNNYIGFMARKPAGMAENTYTAKLAGAENYLKARKSASFADYKASLDKQGLQLAYDNPIQMIMAKRAEINNSLAWREQIQKAKASGQAKTFSDTSQIPDGWSPLPDRLAKDSYVNAPEPGEETKDANGNKVKGILAVPNGFAKAIENMYANQGSGKGPLNAVLSMGRGIRYAFDTFYTARAMTGAVTKSVGELLGGNTGGANPVRDYITGRKAIQNLARMMDDPTTKPLADSLREAMSQGGFRSSALEKAPTPDDVKPTLFQRVGKVLHTLPGAIQKHVTQPLKIGAIIQQHQYATSQGWSPDQVKAYTTEAAKTIDRLYGAGTSVKTLPPPLQAAMSLLTPTIDYRTAGAKLAITGVGKLAQGKVKASPAAKALIGKLVSAAAIGATTQAIATKFNTGKSITPDSAQDLLFPKTGKKNKDGSDQRIALVDTFTPLAETIEEAWKKGTFDAAKSYIDPFVESFAEAYTNKDYRGKTIGNAGQRLWHATAGFGTILPTPDEKAPALSGQNAANLAKQAAGFREAPKYIERSKEAEQAIEKRYNR